MSLSDFYEIPASSLILLLGPSGSGKSTFCLETTRRYLKGNRGAVVYLATESRPDDIIDFLLANGVSTPELDRLRIIDAYSATLADLPKSEHKVVVDGADCTDLTGIGVKVSQISAIAGGSGNLLVFDSLSAPYIFNGENTIRFLRMSLTRFALQGNKVLVCMAEGLGKKEDLVAMQSISNGVIKIEPQTDRRVLNVAKFPNTKPVIIDYVLRGKVEPVKYTLENSFTDQWFSNFHGMWADKPVRRSAPDRVNLIWQQLALWGGMLWDKRFPTMMYNFGKDLYYRSAGELIPQIVHEHPQLQGNKDLTEWTTILIPYLKATVERLGGGEIYLDEQRTNKDEFHIGWNESDICFSFPNVNGALCYLYAGALAGSYKAISDHLEMKKSWEAVEYMCLGLGDSTCRARVVQEGTDGFAAYIESSDKVKIEQVNERITEQMAAYLLTGRPPVQRRRTGEGIHVLQLQKGITLPALSSDIFRRALSMAGVNSGIKLAEYLVERGVSPGESINQLGRFLSYASVGQVQFGERLRIIENAETVGLKSNLPICSFTTGFLNGFSTATRGSKVHEDVCQTAGGEYCEWVFPH